MGESLSLVGHTGCESPGRHLKADVKKAMHLELSRAVIGTDTCLGASATGAKGLCGVNTVVRESRAPGKNLRPTSLVGSFLA